MINAWLGRVGILHRDYATSLIVFIEWALPDQLVYATVSSLLQLASSHPQYSDSILGAILAFSSNIINKLRNSTREVQSLQYLLKLLTAIS